MGKKVILLIIMINFSFLTIAQTTSESCICNTEIIEKIINSNSFNPVPDFAKKVSEKRFYKLTSDENRRLWYRDIENPKETEFTPLWNDYAPNNYHASHIDFVNFYKDKNNIELAFQFGPNMDLWAYLIFVIRKVDDCYLITKSYFRHARFTYKGYAIIDECKLNDLYKVLEPINKRTIEADETFDYRGYFVDNRHNNQFYIDFESEVVRHEEDSIHHSEPKPEIMSLYTFVDDKIDWISGEKEWTPDEQKKQDERIRELELRLDSLKNGH